MRLDALLQCRNILASKKEERLPIKVSYKLMKFLKVTEGEQLFYDEKIAELRDEFFDKDEEDKFVIKENQYVYKEGMNATMLDERLKELSEIEVEVPEIRFTLDELDGISLSAQEAYSIESIIVE